MKSLRILVLHGPNLNLLGSREPDHYGNTTLAEINQQLIELGDQLGAEVINFQSNHEGEIVDRIQQAASEHADTGHIDGIVINPAAYTHTSVALRDALLAARIPFAEVHLSNIHGREEFRQRSLLADAATGIVAGFGATSYMLALRGMVQHLRHIQQGD
ncbi:MAG: type II 3-dehydroquinate dehydratase [Mariprofundaceae bacterium]|nr:type II 3-dehydroquinate dehydratase [Mariprofundaceae bacterium]